MIDIYDLIQDARAIDDDDWGSDRQINAENRLSAAVHDRYGADLLAEWTDASVNHKMTSDEYLDWIEKKVKETDNE